MSALTRRLLDPDTPQSGLPGRAVAIAGCHHCALPAVSAPLACHRCLPGVAGLAGQPVQQPEQAESAALTRLPILLDRERRGEQLIQQRLAALLGRRPGPCRRPGRVALPQLLHVRTDLRRDRRLLDRNQQR